MYRLNLFERKTSTISGGFVHRLIWKVRWVQRTLFQWWYCHHLELNVGVVTCYLWFVMIIVLFKTVIWIDKHWWWQLNGRQNARFSMWVEPQGQREWIQHLRKLMIIFMNYCPLNFTLVVGNWNYDHLRFFSFLMMFSIVCCRRFCKFNCFRLMFFLLFT
jgi:hypothetical protein